MAKLSLIRIDFRLIHGQVVAKWLKTIQATKIIVVNNTLAKDPVMSNIYKMATPADVKCSVVGIDTFMAAWNKNQLGEGNALVLFKDVHTTVEVWKKGFPLDQLQIGGLGAGPGRKAVYLNMTLNPEDAAMLTEMTSGGVNIFFQATPEDKPMEYEKVMENVSF
jgi:D-glucosaminate-specific PTS system IIB component